MGFSARLLIETGNVGISPKKPKQALKALGIDGNIINTSTLTDIFRMITFEKNRPQSQAAFLFCLFY
jgi:hypothetical protein